MTSDPTQQKEIKVEKFAFISRHEPTENQIAMAADHGIELIHVGDGDAFSMSPSFVVEAGNRLDVTFEGAVVVHPAAALRLARCFIIGVFENANRAPAGEKPQFEAKALHLFDLRD